MAGYIGSRASVVSSGAERKKTFDITGTTTVLTGLSYTPTFVHLFHNGVRLVDGTDYTATNGTSITLTTAAQSGDQVVVVSYATFQAADAYTKAEADAGFVSDPNGAVTVDASGNVGIGTTSPAHDLQIGSGTNSATLGLKGSTVGPIKPKITFEAQDGSDRYSWEYTPSGGPASDLLSLSTLNAANVFTVLGSGNVGIGTATPSTTLEVSTAATSNNLRVSSTSGTRYGEVYTDTNGVMILSADVDATGGAPNLRFRVSGTERLRIDASGNVLVGTASLVKGKVTAYGTGAGNTMYSAQPTTNGYVSLNCYNAAGSQVGYIYSSASTTQYNTTSDYRLKENITAIQGAGDIVKAMRPVTYTYKVDGSWMDGFIAHELQELHPTAVNGSKDAMQDEEYEVTPAVEATYDDEGVELTPAVPAVMGTRSVPDYQGVDYSKLTPILTAALQEALNKIDALEARLTALEATP